MTLPLAGRLRETAPVVPGAASSDRNKTVVWMVVVAALVFSAKLVLIAAYGADLPFRDQWDAEAGTVFLPLFNSGWSDVHWFARHNEHWVTVSKIFALALYGLDGQWDAIVQVSAGALVHALCAAVLVRVAYHLPISSPSRTSLLLVIATGFTSPFGWENTLGAFQNSFYFLILATLSLLWFASKPSTRPGVRPIVLTLLAVVAQLSLAAGAFSCLAAVACLLLRQSASPRDERRTRWWSIAALSALAIAQTAMVVAHPSTTPVHPSSAAFLTAFVHALSYPTTLGAPLIWLPWCLLLARHFRRRDKPLDATVVFMVGLGVFVILFAAGIAFGRGDFDASRYDDVLWMGPFVNLAILFVLLHPPEPGRRGRIGQASMALFTIGVIGLLLGSGIGSLDQAAERRADLDASIRSVRDFVRSGDVEALSARSPNALPFPRVDALAFLLSDVTIARILPPSIRLPLMDSNGGKVDVASMSGVPGSRVGIVGPVVVDASHPRFVSAALTSGTRWLMLDVTSDGAFDDVALHVDSTVAPTESMRLRTKLSPGRPAQIVFKVPQTPFRISIERQPDARSTRFEMDGPVEVGWLRVQIDRLLRHAPKLFEFMLATLLVMVCANRSVD